MAQPEPNILGRSLEGGGDSSPDRGKHSQASRDNLMGVCLGRHLRLSIAFLADFGAKQSVPHEGEGIIRFTSWIRTSVIC
jgi:hypothetical protein